MIKSTFSIVLLLVFGVAISFLIGATVAWDDVTETRGVESVAILDNFKKLNNSEIEWDGWGFARAGPKIVGDNARFISNYGVRYTTELMQLIDKPEAFVAAHVLLTRDWRVVEKEYSSASIGPGFVVVYNGLTVIVEWKAVGDQAVKTVTIPDEEMQRERIAYWWKSRRRDFPIEFSERTLVK